MSTERRKRVNTDRKMAYAAQLAADQFEAALKRSEARVAALEAAILAHQEGVRKDDWDDRALWAMVPRRRKRTSA
jgi:hypothetical protein